MFLVGAGHTTNGLMKNLGLVGNLERGRDRETRRAQGESDPLQTKERARGIGAGDKIYDESHHKWIRPEMWRDRFCSKPWHKGEISVCAEVRQKVFGEGSLIT